MRPIDATGRMVHGNANAIVRRNALSAPFGDGTVIVEFVPDRTATGSYSDRLT